LDNAGDMMCWGGNNYGQLGNGQAGQGTEVLTPSVVGNGVFNGKDLEDIAGGWHHHCALEREQSGGTKVWCWGYNGFGQVGDGTTTNRAVPVPVLVKHANGSASALTGVSSIVLGWDITCAAMSAGGVMCWGRNEANWGYACGDGDTTAKKSNPVWVKMSDNSVLQGVVRELFVGQFHSCVLFEDDLDRLVCWGMQTWGIANPNVDPATTTNDGKAREITYFKDRGKRVKSLGLGNDHTCALLTTGTVECWGKNDFGQLGVNCGVNSYTPAQVPGLSGVASIDGGNRFTCVIISFTGEVKCWGNNALNQLGSGFPDNYYGSEASSSCGVTSSVRTSSVANIGTNGNPGARFLAVSWYFTCATMSDFTIRCWGNNEYGQLGDHEKVARTEPVTVLLSTSSPVDNFIAFDTRGACGCCDDMMKARGLNTDCKA
jgi:alpha-tubulin suppressor-like RCC1 family protein